MSRPTGRPSSRKPALLGMYTSRRPGVAKSKMNMSKQHDKEKSSTTTSDETSSSPSATTSHPSASDCTPRNSKESEEPTIQLNEFLDFLKVSCSVNDLIASNSLQKDTSPSHGIHHVSAKVKPKNEIDLTKLADNRLVNELLGHKKQRGRDALPDSTAESASSGAHEHVGERNNRMRRRNSTIVSNLRAANTAKMSGLHPKLSDRLNYVINEGVLDSVLPFVCPVPLPQSMLSRYKSKKDASGCNYHVAANVKGVVPDSGDDTAPQLNTTHADACNQPMVGKRRMLYTKSGSDKKEPEVIIHVCDEVKSASKDFSCPQNLLVSKMGYFADVTAGQRLEDMDISVHCDIQIFEWLMRWVKTTASLEHPNASSNSLTMGPQLDSGNVVPILVSANFLQMEPLLEECLSFCHARLTEVVRAPTNLACLNDNIITRLAAMFTNLELEMVRDKKERVTPRLWTKLIQSLCEPEPETLRGHYYSVAGLFRCSKCGKCVTNTMKSYISCVPSNTRLNRWGQLVNHHVRDNTWDLNLYIGQLFKEMKSWRKVYWKLWGHCHFLYCCICEAHFPLYQMPWCRFHPENPNYLGPVNEGCAAGPTGRFPCCGQQAFRFETLPGPNGCQFREHSVLVETDRERSILNIAQHVAEGNAMYDHPPDCLRDAVSSNDIEPRWYGILLTPQRSRQGLLPILNPDECTNKVLRRNRHRPVYDAESSSESENSDTTDLGRARPCGKYLNRVYSAFRTMSAYSDGGESECSSPNYDGKGKKRVYDTPGRFWSGELSARSNQDHQREFEEKVMKQVIALVNQRTGSDHNMQNATLAGGTYYRLESEWKEQLKQRNLANAAANSSASNTTALSNGRPKK